MNPQVEILVCSYGDRVEQLGPMLAPKDPRLGYFVSHQGGNSAAALPTELAGRGDVRYARFEDRGLSRNRNHALDAMTGEICLIADDDLEYREGFVDLILDAFAAHQEWDFITFAADRSDGGPYRGNYPQRATRHSWRDVYHCISWEIAFRRESVQRAGVRFRECFGIGAKYGFGEEAIFLHDLLSAGLVGGFSPSVIVTHPPESTGTHVLERMTPSIVRTMGAVAGFKWGALANLLAFKEYLRLDKYRAGAGMSRSSFREVYAEGMRGGITERRKGFYSPAAVQAAGTEAA